MTDKEQIIIDGVDVSTCKGLKYKSDGIKKPICLGGGIRGIYRSCLCENNQNCYFKQLARKTQECEELKEEIETYKRILNNPELKVSLTDVRTGEREIWRKLGSKADRYRKALEEIGGIVSKDYYDDTWADISIKLDGILDIINKAKAEEDKQ